MTKPKKTSDWEKEFDRLFLESDSYGNIKCYYPATMRDFIRQVRQEAIKEVLESVKLKKLNRRDRFYSKGEIEAGFEYSYNVAVSKLDLIIKGIKKREGIK